MKILSIALKDLRIFFKDPGYWIYLVALPLIFIQLFTALFSASVGETESQERARLVVVNQDAGGVEAEKFLHELDVNAGIDVIPATLDEAQDDFRDTRITTYLVIPQDFTAKIQSGEQAKIEVIALDAQSLNIQSLRMLIDGVANDMMLEISILDSLKQFAEMQASAPEEFQVYDIETLTAQAKSQLESSHQRPLVNIEEEYPREESIAEGDFSMAQFSVPGFAVLFAFLVAQATARSIYDEKKTGSFRRLLAAPLAKFQLLSGKLLPNLLIVLFQIGLIFAASVLILPLTGMERLSLGQSPGALVAVSFCVALCSTSLGILIAAIARTEAQIGGFSALLLWLMGFLGGTMVPLDIMSSPLLTTISKFVPQSHAVEAYKDILVRGAGFTDILPALGILLGFSLLFFAVGLWRFDFD